MMGGFITAAARQARANFRPLLAPPPSAPANTPPSLAKRLYDISSIVLSAFILNYAASPFIILSGRDSITTWSRLGWYGHIIVMGSLLVFSLGGNKYFRALQKKKGVLPPPRASKPVNGTAASSTNGTPVEEKNFILSPSVDKVIPSK